MNQIDISRFVPNQSVLKFQQVAQKNGLSISCQRDIIGLFNDPLFSIFDLPSPENQREMLKKIPNLVLFAV
jgi:hypothetical protein